MSFWRYQLLRTAVSFAVFVAMLPVFFLLVGLFGLVLPAEALPIFPGLMVLIGELVAIHLITEKLSQRWSR